MTGGNSFWRESTEGMDGYEEKLEGKT